MSLEYEGLREVNQQKDRFDVNIHKSCMSANVQFVEQMSLFQC